MSILANGALLLAAVAGHTELWIALVNRVHALRLSSGVLTNIRRIHDVAIPLFPVWLFWSVGLSSGGVLRGGSWSTLSVGWQATLAVCGLGFAALCGVMFRWRRRLWSRPVAPQTAEVVDVARALGRRPIGRGSHRWMARLPLNEAFQVEFSEKKLPFAALPQELDGLRILHLSDMHILGTVDRPYYDYVFDRLTRIPVDLIAFTGDLFDDFTKKDWLQTTFARLDAPLGRHFILGNHDWYLDAAEIRRTLRDLGWTDAAAAPQTLDVRGRALSLAGSEYPWMGPPPTPAHSSSAPRDAFKLLLSHTPDDLPFARRAAFDLMLAGHNHGGQVVLPLVGPVYSPSRFGVRYAGGTFWEPPTMLHVSRGLSGRHPLRWRCRPEIAVLTLTTMR